MFNLIEDLMNIDGNEDLLLKGCDDHENKTFIINA